MLDVVWIVSGWLLGWWLFGRPRQLGLASPQVVAADGPSISVIIPARNEQKSLPNLLGDLGLARPACAEVVVVDDCSADRTVEIAESFDFVRVVRAGSAPDGWVGKPWACHVGALAARTETLVFLDADVRVEPSALEAVLDQLDAHGGLVSVEPFHVLDRTYEQASALLSTVSFIGIGAGASRPESAAGAFGPVMATSRRDYDLVGGHRAVRDEIVEDIALAEIYKEHDLPVSVLTGGELLRFRMYPDGPGALIEGWTKNLATGASRTPWIRLAGTVVWLTAMGTAFSTLVRGIGDLVPTLAGLAVYCAFALQLRAMFSRLGNFSALSYMLFPLQLAVFFYIFFLSLWLTVVRRRVRWRGREIAIPSTRET